MKKSILTFSLVVGAVAVAEEPIKNVQYSLASYPKWKEIEKLRQQILDLEVTEDGKTFRGNLNFLPTLDYPFGNLSFKHNEVAIVFRAPKDPKRLVYITNDGERYVGTPNTSGFEFVTDNDIFKDISKTRLIIMSIKDEQHPLIPLRNLYTLKTTNGDTFSIVFADTNFSFGNWKKEVVAVDDIESISKQEGVHYTHGDKKEHRIPFIIKDKSFNVFIPKLDETLPMRWDEVESIEKVNPDKDTTTIAEILALLPKELQARIMPGVWNESDYLLSSAGMGAFVKNEPEVLFDPTLGFDIPEGIVFESVADDLHLKMSPETVLTLSEALVYQSIAMVDIEPEAFDVPPVDIEDEEETESFNFVAGNQDKEEKIVAITEATPTNEIRLSAEQIAELKKILESEDQEVADSEEGFFPVYGDDEGEPESTESLPIDRDNSGDEQFEPAPDIHK